MTSKTSRPASSHEVQGHGLTPWSFLADLSRQQMSFATEGACALFRSSEAIRQVQQQAAHHASEQYAAAAQKLRGATQPAELLAVQAELLRFDLEEANRYWQKLMTAALQAQTEMMGTASHMLDGDAGGGVKSALQAMQAAIPPMSSSFFATRPDGPVGRSQASA
ncbi:MAG: phasin family protein [Lacisediminimonas sp.]|nr:phasin family protein [Lacisediminimonas sp.]